MPFAISVIAVLGACMSSLALVSVTVIGLPDHPDT
jgi:hypothetical protein